MHLERSSGKEPATAEPFPSILCGVEADPASAEAARQAIALARADAEVHFIAVSTTVSLPKYKTGELEASLEQAARLARASGVSATTDLVTGGYVVDTLLAAGEHHDLLVVGSRNRSRLRGIMLGATAGEAAHKTHRPLLVAREPPSGEEFPQTILVASDGSPASWPAARAAAAIAAAFDSRLDVVHVAEGARPERRRAVEAQIAEIREITGQEPGLEEPEGHAAGSIIASAGAKLCSLIVSGRRGLRGVMALGSVSERVVHRAPCSVLLMPAGHRVWDF